MPTALLIGLSYSGQLKSTESDLSAVEEWCGKMGYDTHTYTDRDSHVPLEIFLTGLTVEDEKFIVYYTGHGLGDAMLLTDGRRLPFSSLISLVRERVGKWTEILVLVDACVKHCGMGLCYRFDSDRFVQTEGKKMDERTMIILSSTEEEKAYASREGSVFTRRLLSFLDEESRPIIRGRKIVPSGVYRNLSLLSSELTDSMKDFRQKVSIYSSYGDQRDLWLWVGKRSTSNPYGP